MLQPHVNYNSQQPVAAGYDHDAIAALLRKQLGPSVLRLIPQSDKYVKYASDPVAFGTEVLGDRYTPDVIKLMESVRDYPVTVACSANATGKTHAAARIAVWFYKCFPQSQVYTAAAPPCETNLKKILWGQIGDIFSKNETLFKNDTFNSLEISRSPLEKIIGVSIPSTGLESQREAKFAGKHAPNLLFIIDEGDAVPDECYRGIESCTSGGHMRVLIMFNPRHASGAAYRMIRDNRCNVVQMSAFSHPNVISGVDLFKGAVSREVTTRRINEWCSPLLDSDTGSGLDTFELPEFLVDSVAHRQDGTAYPPLQAGSYAIDVPAFSYMVLGRYPGQSVNQLISREWVNAARARYDKYVLDHGHNPPADILPIMGADCAGEGDDSNVVCFRYGGFTAPLHRWSGVDPYVSANRMSELYHKYNAIQANVDATGLGAGVAPRMVDLKCNAYGIWVAGSPPYAVPEGNFKNIRALLCWKAREFLRSDPSAMLPPDEFLCEELLAAQYEIKGGFIAIDSSEVIKSKIKRSWDRAVSFFMTFADVQSINCPIDISRCAR